MTVVIISITPSLQRIVIPLDYGNIGYGVSITFKIRISIDHALIEFDICSQDYHIIQVPMFISFQSLKTVVSKHITAV